MFLSESYKRILSAIKLVVLILVLLDVPFGEYMP